MEPNLRKDEYFVQDDSWYEQEKAYEDFISNAKDKKAVLLEFGVGFNTPGIIRIPFEKMVYQNENWNLVRFNKEYSGAYLDIHEKTISVEEDINDVLEKIIERDDQT